MTSQQIVDAVTVTIDQGEFSEPGRGVHQGKKLNRYNVYVQLTGEERQVIGAVRKAQKGDELVWVVDRPDYEMAYHSARKTRGEAIEDLLNHTVKLMCLP